MLTNVFSSVSTVDINCEYGWLNTVPWYSYIATDLCLTFVKTETMQFSKVSKWEIYTRHQIGRGHRTYDSHPPTVY